MKTSIFSLPEANMTYAQAVNCAKQAGCALEPFPRAEFAAPDEEAAKRLGEACQAANVPISCFSMMADFAAPDLRAEIDRLKAYARVAAAMGSPYLHHTLMPSLDPVATAIPFGWALERSVAAAREVAEYAAGLGVSCLYEDQGYVFNGCVRFGEFLEKMGSEAGVVADLGNIYFVDETAEAFAGRFAARVKHVHAKDYLLRDGRDDFPGEEWYRTAAGNRLLGTCLGYGRVPVGSVLRILQSAGYDGYFSLEYDGPMDGWYLQNVGLRNLRRYDAAMKAADAVRE